MSERTLYFGPPNGFYEPARFNDFALIDVPQRLIKIGSPSECNPESRGGGLSASPQEGITYHYPNAGIGIFYQRIVPERCVVRLVGTREREMNEITKFIFEKDNEE